MKWIIILRHVNMVTYFGSNVVVFIIKIFLILNQKRLFEV